MKMVFYNMYSFINSYARIGSTLLALIMLALLRFVSCTREGTNNPFAPIEDSFLQFESLKVDRDHIAPNGDKAVVKAIIKDALGKRAPGKTVEFSALLGKITTSAITDTQGIAQADYSSGIESGRDTIFAFIQRPKRGTVWDTTFVEIQAQASLSLSATSPILADGESKSNVSVIIRNERNNPVSGAVVKFTTTLGSVPGSAQTDANGSAKVALTSERRNGIAVVRAEYNSLKDSIEVMFTGVIITMTATPSTLIADGTSWSSLHVEVKDAKNFAIQGEPVIMTSLFSEIQKPQGRTNAAGVFVDSVRSNHSGKDTIRARAAGSEGTVVITYIGYQLHLSSTKTSINTRTDTSIVTAILLDTKGTAVPYATVRFSTTLGRFTRIDSITAPNGEARAWFVSDEIGSAEIRAEAVVAGSIAQDNSIIEIHAQLRLTLSAVSPIQADGVSTSKVTVTLRNEKNNPISGATITFKTGLGTIPLSSQTNANGVAQVDLISERRNGIASIRAEYNGIADSIEVLFTGVTVGVTATPNNLFADGKTWVGIRVQVKDAANLAIQGENVVLFSSLRSEFKRGNGRTDAAGVFTDSVRNSSAGADTITVQAAGSGGSASVTYTGYRLEVTANPSTFTAQVETTVVQAILFDNNNQPVKNVPVSFATTIGEFIREDSVTNNNGTATASIISVGIGTADVTAEAIVTGITIRKTIQITIKSAKARKVQLQASPRVVRVNGGESTLSATVTDATGNPVPNISVNYGVLLGPHGGETVNPPFAATNANGIASTKFISGSRSSDSTNDVRIQARIQGTQIVSNVVTLTIAGAPDTIVLGYGQPVLDNGRYTLQISAIVSDINGNPVIDGTPVNFSTKPTIGIITSPATTTGGIATSNLVYPISQAGSKITVLVESSGISDSLTIQELPGATGEVNSVEFAEITPKEVLANGLNEVTVKVHAKDSKNSAITNQNIKITMQHDGKEESKVGVTTQAVDAQGNAIPNLVSPATVTFSLADTVDKYPIFVATAGGKSSRSNDDSSFVFRGIDFQLFAAKNVIRTGEQLQVNVLLKEKVSKIAIQSATIRLGATVGTIENSMVTDSKGQASTLWDPGTATGQAIITATYGSTILKSMPIIIMVENPASVRIATDTVVSLLANGLDQTVIQAQVLDRNGLSFEGFPITFTQSGPGSLSNVSTVTDTGGWVRATFKSRADSNDQDAYITIKADTATSAKIHVKQRGIRFTLQASPQELVANGFKQSLITARLIESRTNVSLTSGTVTFEVDSGLISPSATIANGIARVYYTSSEISGTRRVRAFYGNTLSKDVFLTLYPSQPKNIQLSISPTAIQVKGTGGNEIATITGMVTDAGGDTIVDRTPVIFTTNRGEFPNQLTTDTVLTQNGVALIQLRSGYISGLIRIAAKDINNTISESKMLLTIQPGPPKRVQLSADTTNLTADGNILSFQVSVILQDTMGNPVVDGTLIAFRLFSGDPGFKPDSAQITLSAVTSNGIARATVSYHKQYANHYITIYVGAQDIDIPFNVKLAGYEAPASSIVPSSIFIVADTNNVTIDPNNSFIRSFPVSALVRTANGNLISISTPVIFELDSTGTGAGVDSPIFTQNGIANSKLTYRSEDRGNKVNIKCRITGTTVSARRDNVPLK